MPISQHFTAIEDVSITFNNSSINLNNTEHSTLKDLLFQIRGGEMVLVVGNPTSNFFKSIFNSKKNNLNYEPKNSIKIKSNEINSFIENCPHQVNYNNENDMHFPFLTVNETIDFALNCKFDLTKDEKILFRDNLLKEFGLSHVSNTIVGDDFVRGISGGERKRISIIETFIANGSIYLWDNSTKGLDSTNALEFLNILQKMSRKTNSINFVKISQASDKIVEKFDKVLLLADSHQIFFGSIDECMHHFQNNLNITKNPNDCIIEYLTSILNFQFNSAIKKMIVEDKYCDGESINLSSESDGDTLNKKNYHLNAVKKYDEIDLYQAWINSKNYAMWKQLISLYVQSNNMANDKIDQNDITPIFAIPLRKQLQYLVSRAFKRSLGDKIYLLAQLFSIIVQSLVIGSLFYNIPLTTIGSYSRGSLTFFSILFFTFLSLAEMPASFQKQKIVNKQAKLFFYYPWLEALATTTFEYFYKMLLVIVFSILLYFIAHLQYDPARFFIFLLFLTIYNFSMVSLFQTISLLSPTLAVANLFAGILLLAIALYASYVIYLSDMHPWFVWIAYINPAMYAMESILSNELFDLKLDCSESIIPRGATYSDVDFTHKACAWRGATLGNDYVRGQDYLNQGLSYSYSHTWRNFGILVAFVVFFVSCSLLASQYIKPLYDDEYNFFRGIFKSKKHSIESEEITSPSFSDVSISNFEDDYTDEKFIKANPTKVQHGQNHIISWRNIIYDVNGKRLINDVTGYISSGLTALMGESGAGKTTLLNVLSQRIEDGVVTGELLIDGKPLTDVAAFKRSIGFVQQQDVHLDLLTVEESLKISCVLRGDGDRNYIKTISDLLKLPEEKLVQQLTPTEKKLLSIGVELVTKPSLLLFLDEPTSGLDSEAALTIVRFLKNLSLQGQAIFCTIHQPSKSVISYFDNIFLLKRGGENVYFGPTVDAPKYFMSNDSMLEFNELEDNPADFIIDVVGNSKKNDEKIDGLFSNKEKNWSKIWSDSMERQNINNTLVHLEDTARQEGTNFTAGLWAQPSYFDQIKLIVKRQYICTKRDKSYVYAKYALNGGAGLFIGFSFWDTKRTIAGLQDCIFFCFMALCVSSPLINQVQDKALRSKEVFIARESRSATYHWSVLLLAQVIIELPLAISSSALFFVCSYFCCNFDNSAHIAGVFFLNYILFSAYYLTFGLWLIYATPNLQTASVLVAFFYSFTASFCGVMQPYSLFPGFWKFMYRISPYTYFIDTFVSLILHDRKVECATLEFVPGQPTNGQTCGKFMQAYIDEYGGYMLNSKSLYVCGYCTYTVGDDFLEVEGMSYDNRWRNFGIECAFVGFNFISMFIGYYLTYVIKIWPKIGKILKKSKKSSTELK